MTNTEWNDPSVGTLMVHLNGAVETSDPSDGPPCSVLILINGDEADRTFTLPADLAGDWRHEIDTGQVEAPDKTPVAAGDTITVVAYGLVVLTEDAEDGA